MPRRFECIRARPDLRLAGTYTRAETLKSPGFPKLKLQLKEVFDFPLMPDEKAALAVREGPSPAYATKRPRRGTKFT